MITFVLPCYQSNLRFVAKAIDSVLVQSNNDWRLIVVDGNQSKDIKLYQLVKSYPSDKVSYIKNPSTSPSIANNWNYGLSLSTTDLVTLLHDDDFLAPRYVEKMLGLSEKFPESSCYFSDVHLVNELDDLTVTFADTVKRWLTPNSDLIHLEGDKGLAGLLAGCFIFCPTLCYRKSAIPRMPYSNKWKMVLDFQFYYDILISGGVITGTSEKLYHYRRHQQNQTLLMTNDMTRFSEEVSFYSYVRCQLSDSDWPLSINVAKSQYIIKMHLAYLFTKQVICLRLSKAKKILEFYLFHFKPQ